MLVANATQFPSGIKALADAVHAAGFKFGIYTDRGTKTCGGRPGSFGYEQLDASTFAAIGVDFLKEDSCYAADSPDVAWPQYAKMRDALNATGRPIYFNLCGWHSWYAPVGAALGNSWRTGGDDQNWPGILSNIDIASELAQYASPGIARLLQADGVRVCAASYLPRRRIQRPRLSSASRCRRQVGADSSAGAASVQCLRYARCPTHYKSRSCAHAVQPVCATDAAEQGSYRRRPGCAWHSRHQDYRLELYILRQRACLRVRLDAAARCWAVCNPVCQRRYRNLG